MTRKSYTDDDLLDALVDFQLTGPEKWTLQILGSKDGSTVIAATDTKAARTSVICSGATLRQAIVALMKWREANPYDPKIHGS